jgi:uncharacterized protein
MTDPLSDPCTAFRGQHLLHSGPRLEVALAVKHAVSEDSSEQILVFDDSTGRIVDLDLRGTDQEIAERLASPPTVRLGRFRPTDESQPQEDSERKSRGRPRLGVVSREVTLLPRHWDWLATQRGGASAALRRLVDHARQQSGSETRERAARDATYAFMHAMAGDLPGFEEATRALFAGDRATFAQLLENWPADIQAYALRLGFNDHQPNNDE